MNGTLPLYDTKPIAAGDELEEGSAVFRPILTSPQMAIFTTERMRFGVFVQSGTVGPYRTSTGVQFCNFCGTLSDPSGSPHFRTHDEADSWIIEQIQQAREELMNQITEVMESANCRHKKTKGEPS